MTESPMAPGKSMISRQVLVLGATGMLGQPVVECLISQGHRVRALVRNSTRARQVLGDTVEIFEARLVATMPKRDRLSYVAKLIAYFDKVGELGDPAEANALLGAPSTTLDEWFTMPHRNWEGLPH